MNFRFGGKVFIFIALWFGSFQANHGVELTPKHVGLFCSIKASNWAQLTPNRYVPEIKKGTIR